MSYLSGPETPGDYEKREKAISEVIKKKLSKAKKTEILEELDKSEEEDVEMRAMCRLARSVFEEALDCYEDGEYTWKEFVSELTDSLEALSSKK